MDDPPISLPVPSSHTSKVVRACEPSRLQTQLLAQAYQLLCPQIRRKLQTPPALDAAKPLTAAPVAAGA